MSVNAIHQRFHRSLLFGMMLSSLLCGCSGTASAPLLEASKLELRIVVGDNVNLDDKGRAAPIEVRIYELKSEGVFQQTDFFTLQKQDTLALGADLLLKDEFVFLPGESRTIHRKSQPQTIAIGVLAAYRQLGTATWRGIYKLKPAPAAWYRAVLPNNKVKLNIELQANDIKIRELD